MAVSAPVTPHDFACSICLEDFTTPTTLGCGHTFCKRCIERHWDRECEVSRYSCPECRHLFYRKPELGKNVLVAYMVETLKSLGVASSPGRTCERHGLTLDLYCRLDSELICVKCTDTHGRHDIVTADTRRHEATEEVIALKRRLTEREERLAASVSGEEDAVEAAWDDARSRLTSAYSELFLALSAERDSALGAAAAERAARLAALADRRGALRAASEALRGIERLQEALDPAEFIQGFKESWESLSSRDLDPAEPPPLQAAAAFAPETPLLAMFGKLRRSDATSPTPPPPPLSSLPAVSPRVPSTPALSRAPLTPPELSIPPLTTPRLSKPLLSPPCLSTPPPSTPPPVSKLSLTPPSPSKPPLAPPPLSTTPAPLSTTPPPAPSPASPPLSPPPPEEEPEPCRRRSVSSPSEASDEPDAPPGEPKRRSRTALFLRHILGPQPDPTPGGLTRSELVRRYGCRPTLNRDSCHTALLVSPSLRRVTLTASPSAAAAPAHPQRFEHCPQVVAREAFSSGAVVYWEVSAAGGAEGRCRVGVAYPTVARKDPARDGLLGRGRDSWCVERGGDGLAAWHGGVRVPLGPCGQGPGAIGVFLDWDAGLLTFYEPRAARPLHSFRGAFDAPLVPALWLWGCVDYSLAFVRLKSRRRWGPVAAAAAAGRP